MAPKGKKQQKEAAKDKKTMSRADSTLSIVSDWSVDENSEEKASHRSVTGVLHSKPTARDIKIGGFSMMQYGELLIEDTTIELTIGRRYGLLGQNGCGKSTFLQCLAHREVPVPEHIDIFLLEEEAAPSELTAVEAVIEEVKNEILRLEQEADDCIETEGPESERVLDIYQRLEELGEPDTFQATACKLLLGLGFSSHMMQKKTKDLSGGWRMRVSLARALFVKPTLLLLDEPTNHLDLEACVWLEEYLKNYNKCLVIVSHSQDFLNEVCTNIVEIRQKRLTYWTGNYDAYVQTRIELETNQLKKFEKEQDDIKHIKQFISSCGTYSNLVRQAKSKQKIIDKMEAAGLTERPTRDKQISFRFPECGKLPLPVLAFAKVSFAYDGKKDHYLYSGLELGVDLDSRIALVGPNGAGKSTLLKLMSGDLMPSQGTVSRHTHLRIARYHQHLKEMLDIELSPIDFIMSEFPDRGLDLEAWRSQLGRYGLTSTAQVIPIKKLSDGLQNRVVFAYIALKNPHLLLLDEPTNHLDMETIDALAEAINAFEGGMVLVSHDFRLINQVAKEIWVCEHKAVNKWPGTISEYKAHLKKKMQMEI
eukprot:TRINITY_DN887_c0_g1::TRINITY_DN887_c0_g1_i1::g.25452::m.25452 TRINITY_DN887_c0_g1::TRINITY_DN887_c0_g1_i1::g.25452  ORF type:complete len:592 (+),score=217.93,sp/Q8T6B7/ABCF2_DICDI/59.96/0.0,ABC_tran/PF00005.22/7.1e-22,ABC_tran/PF00005.22/9.8e+02,ABC_tran/PF00005.22/3.8e-20,AAA_21/PF13304.1/0.067,AAA_21/PF13304.1/0.00081,AAA_21/PF13304.1/0.00071,AAA_21/PF13304.1/8.5e-06,ABC_tran_2/PF12848.2/3.7e+02,ABC_tran_2/PF12848.2/1.3e-18,ABC_tran_2/PF12848.2/6.6e+02,SMC_N/PF02463.14/2.9,SMC_N/PF02463.14/0.